jgi:hypothetical protein
MKDIVKSVRRKIKRYIERKLIAYLVNLLPEVNRIIEVNTCRKINSNQRRKYFHTSSIFDKKSTLYFDW